MSPTPSDDAALNFSSIPAAHAVPAAIEQGRQEMVSRLMVALVLVAATVAGGAAVAYTAVHISASGIPAPSGTPTPTRHGHGAL